MSDEVSNFLRSVEQLNHRSGEDEEARSKDRELEEKILQQRKERQARREERARSISPQKSSPANTPPPSARRKDSTPQATEAPASASSPIPDLSAGLQNRSIQSPPTDAMDPPSSQSISHSKESPAPLDLDLDLKRASETYTSPPSSAVPTRTPTLSWQRRPPSQGPDRSKSRPLSMFAAENAAARSSTPPGEATSPDQATSRDQISQALGSKDPSWFRQTADRGANSAAYRTNQVEDVDTVDMSSARSQLPGMSRPSSTEPQKDAVNEPLASQANLGRLGSPLPVTDAQKLGPSADIQTGKDESSSGQISPARPASPTKGMGGFVQSAMMKRTDSIKRWSVNTPGLQRGGSTANRNSIDGKNGTTSPGPEGTSRPGSRSKEITSRPTSSHAKDPPTDATSPKENAPEALNPDSADDKTPPTSPSRTMDQRRWSPTKGSWLDAALNKPESPKPKPAAPPSNQPAWMVELNRAKAEKAKNASVDLGRTASNTVKKHEVKTGGLVRPAALGTTVKPSSYGGLPSPSLGGEKPLTPTFRSGLHRASASIEKQSPRTEELERRGSVTSPPVGKDKPETPPKKDFRTGLRPRGPTVGSADKQPGNELANVFGNLRKTRTQNYVAPDELKDNILKGKGALNLTDGPRPYVKKDEFKDAILKKKDDFKHAKEEGRGVATNTKTAQEQAIPEGLARRATITRSGTFSHSRDASAVKSPSETSAKGFESQRSSIVSASSPPNATEEGAAGKVERAEPTPVPSLPKEKSTPGRLQSRPGSLADRFNPALAGLLARGPPGMGGAATNTPGTSSRPGVSDAGSEPGQGPQLTHMTKNRARGPRRKAPTTTSKPDESDESKVASTPTLEPQSEEPVGNEAVAMSPPPPAPAQEEKTRPIISPKTFTGSQIASPVEQFKGTMAENKPRDGGVISLVDSSSKTFTEQQRASTGTRIALVDPSGSKADPGSPKKIHEQVAAIAAKAQPPPPEEKKVEEQPPSPRKLALRRMSKFLDEAGQPSPKSEPETTRSPSPVKRTFAPPQKSEPEPVRSPSPVKKSFEPEPVRSLSPVKQSFELPQKSEPQPVRSSSPVKQPLELPQKSEPQPVRSSSPVKQSFELPQKSEPRPVRSPSPVKGAFGAPQSPRKLPEPKKVDSQPTVSVKSGAAMFGRADQPPQKSEPVPMRSPSPRKNAFEKPPSPRKLPEPEKVDPQPAVSVRNGAAMFGGPVTPAKSQKASERPVPAPLDLRPRSPTKTLPSRALPDVPGTPANASPLASPTRSPSTKSAAEVSTMFRDFFGNERPKRNYRIDAGELLMNRPKGGSRVQTQKAQLFQVTEQGKRIPVHSHYERVLFEREMYICSHTFTNEARKKVSEVYFWAGDDVLPSVVEDAQAFINKEARSLGGTLVKMSQGKETAEFIQALGGIVIIRRGSSNKYDSLASNMLCGRQYVGQIVFDEVDFAPTGLCSGFPYLITQQGKCYLWKGKGSGIDELSCARLIGMDLALMGELIEMEEGKEPENFWDMFNGTMKLGSADHWRLKPSYDKYCGRLFCSDSADRRQIIEINPFSQSDLSPTKIYVLDAFFEMYIVVGRDAQSQYASFHNALDFAQEYAILAAGMEDRPFVPVSTVVLEGIPRDLRSCFRKWREDLSPTKMLPPNSAVATPRSLKRARSLRVVPLGQALQALENSE